MIFEGKGNPQFHTGSDGAMITGNLIAGVQSIAGTLGIGIRLYPELLMTVESMLSGGHYYKSMASDRRPDERQRR
jgi:hypothetical protein